MCFLNSYFIAHIELSPEKEQPQQLSGFTSFSNEKAYNTRKTPNFIAIFFYEILTSLHPQCLYVPSKSSLMKNEAAWLVQNRNSNDLFKSLNIQAILFSIKLLASKSFKN